MVFNKFTFEARQVIFRGMQLACETHSAHVTPEHLVLAIVDHLDIQADRLRSTLLQEIRTGPCGPAPRDIPLSRDALAAVEVASSIASQGSHDRVGILHLIAGISRLEGAVAARLLNENRAVFAAVSRETAAPASSPFWKSLLTRMPWVRRGDALTRAIRFGGKGKFADALKVLLEEMRKPGEDQWQRVKTLGGHAVGMASAMNDPAALLRVGEFILEHDEHNASGLYAVADALAAGGQRSQALVYARRCYESANGSQKEYGRELCEILSKRFPELVE
jgi:hypothetical protein